LTEAFKTQASESGRIDLSQKGLSDMHTTTLGNLIKTNTGIKSLDLSGNRISDEGIMAVIKALCESQIEVVSLAKNKLTDACSEQIAQTLKSNKHLKYLDLSDNNIANRVSKNKLKNSLKKIEVVV
jgi:NLR family CARD domain-containing protein 3